MIVYVFHCFNQTVYNLHKKGFDGDIATTDYWYTNKIIVHYVLIDLIYLMTAILISNSGKINIKKTVVTKSSQSILFYDLKWKRGLNSFDTHTYKDVVLLFTNWLLY